MGFIMYSCATVILPTYYPNTFKRNLVSFNSLAHNFAFYLTDSIDKTS